MMELKGKLALITGSTGKLGQAIILDLARAGCNCICQYHKNINKSDELREQIQKLGVKTIALKADLTDEKQTKQLFVEASELGTVEILINSAAVFSKCELDKVTFENTRDIFDLNLIAPLITSRIFAAGIKSKFGNCSQPVGKIINIADVGGIKPWACFSTYCASKAGLIGLTKSLAKELAPSICVNSIAPGVVTWPEDFDNEAKKRQFSFIPARRIGTPQEVASAVLFLLQNDYITGQVLCIDGGRSM